MELRVNEVAIPEQITFNYEELKQELTEKVSMYETLVYDDTQIKEAKADKANLNKLKKALNDERIRREKEYMKPFNLFKEQVNEIIGIIDKPIAVIDAQVKEYEEKEKGEKRQKIESYWQGELREDITTIPPEWLKLEQIWDDRWLNKTVSIATAKEDIKKWLRTISEDLETLAALPEFGFEATEVYKTTLDMNKALNEGRRLAEIQKRKQEQEAQAKAQAEAEAAKAEEPKPEPPKPDFINPPEEAETPAKWVNFSAYLTTPQALALKEFFEVNHIQFKPI